MLQTTNELFGTTSAALLVLLHCKLEHLNCPWDPRRLAGTIISTIQFYKAWTALIALQFDVSDCK
jgi:hypothetical protein